MSLLLLGAQSLIGCGGDDTSSGTEAGPTSSQSSGGDGGRGGEGGQGHGSTSTSGEGGAGGAGGGVGCTDGETKPCYTGDITTKGIGTCKEGTQTCNKGEFGACEGEVLPVNESCDGLDNDCNGTADDGDPGGGADCTVMGQQGACAAGAEACTNGVITCVQTVMPTDEMCDNIDNNCDGTVDDGDPGGGGDCMVMGQQGACAAGTEQCQNGAIACVQTVMPTDETCDGVDNNCDGTVDDGNPGGGGACMVMGKLGACAVGTENCTGGSIECTQNVQPMPEVCGADMVDDDCDGTINNGCPPAVCGNGVVELGEQCDDGNAASGDGCSATCQTESSTCAHDKCQEGDVLDPACDPCVSDICAVDDFCCTTSWDSVCIGEVESVCGESCAGVCIHDKCVTGGALDPACDPCVSDICAVDDFCCTNSWDNICVGEVESVCGGMCAPAAVCGNGVVEAGETCDDGNTTAGDGCSDTCQTEGPACAHDVCMTGSALDPACDPCVQLVCFFSSDCCATGWDDTCVATAESFCGVTCSGGVCGNGMVEAGETCDDGNTMGGDGCSATCQTEGGACAHDKCVEGDALDATCSDPCVGQICAQDSFCCTNAWDSQCVGEVVSICGETCPVPVCGNNMVEAGEQCDDGNTMGGDGCSATCQTESGACAHDKCEEGEALDAACNDPCVGQICAADSFCCTDSWDSICVGEVESVCGEMCAPAVCGNGTVETGEQCDDSNTTAGDGCSDTCQLEAGACAHHKCLEGDALDPACDPCVSQVCTVDDFCCTTAWDNVCVGEVESVCGETCP